MFIFGCLSKKSFPVACAVQIPRDIKGVLLGEAERKTAWHADGTLYRRWAWSFYSKVYFLSMTVGHFILSCNKSINQVSCCLGSGVSDASVALSVAWIGYWTQWTYVGLCWKSLAALLLLFDFPRKVRCSGSKNSFCSQKGWRFYPDFQGPFSFLACLVFLRSTRELTARQHEI